jgi:ATP11 protein
MVSCSRGKILRTFAPELPNGEPSIACMYILLAFYSLLMTFEHGFGFLLRLMASPFFVQPIFRDDGFFMMISQFQHPSHFLMAYLEDYKMDPAAAQPLLTFSVFDDYAESKDLTLVRCDILNRGLHDSEGRKIVVNIIESYTCDVEYATVQTFNKRPQSFDVDDFISRQNEKWRKDPPSVSVR